MPGSKLNCILCLIIISNGFGAHGSDLDKAVHLIGNATSDVLNCLDQETPSQFPDDLQAEDILPHIDALWKQLQETLDLSKLNLTDSRSVTQRIIDDGYRVINYTITTNDSYSLTYFRIPCGKKNCHLKSPRSPVLIQHGFFTYSGSWIAVAKEDCLPYILADAGYDVWLGNARGTLPSRRHKNPNISDAEYWDFEWEKMGTHDIPSAIDYILGRTRFRQLYYIGHSMGTTMAFAGLSLRPEYSDKIKVFFALAPVAWLFKSTTVLRLLAPAEVVFQGSDAIDLVNIPVEVNHPYVNELLQRTLHAVCNPQVLSSVVCGNLAFLICGFDVENTNFPAFSKLIGQFLSSISLKTLRHFLQSNIRDHFRRYDYGPFENYERYGDCIPPDYDVAAIRSKTVFFYGDSDSFSQIEDVEKLIQNYNQTLLKLQRMPPHWNHLDFLIAKNASKYVAQPIMKYMRQNPIK